MKEEIIILAKEKGFESTFLYNQPMKYSSKEELRWLFWMTELQAWLREVHKIYIYILPTINGEFGNGIMLGNVYHTQGHRFELDEVQGTYEEAFEAGLFEALNLIKPKEQ